MRFRSTRGLISSHNWRVAVLLMRFSLCVCVWNRFLLLVAVLLMRFLMCYDRFKEMQSRSCRSPYEILSCRTSPKLSLIIVLPFSLWDSLMRIVYVSVMDWICCRSPYEIRDIFLLFDKMAKHKLPFSLWDSVRCGRNDLVDPSLLPFSLWDSNFH